MRASSLLWLPFAGAAVIPSQQPRSSKTATEKLNQCFNGTSAASAKSITAGPTPPTSAFVVPGDFIGFGFDSAFINNYGNQFSQNLVDNIAQRIPGPIILRIGGTSQDKLTYDPNQAQAVTCIGNLCPAGPGTRVIVGPSYFDGFANFPNQLMTFQAPMGPKINDSNIVDYVTLAYKSLGADRLAGIALGNEPDLYASQYGITYTAQDYTTAALHVENVVQQALGFTDSDVIFEAPDIAGYGNFQLTDVFEAGMNDNGLIKYAAEHWYQLDNPPNQFGYDQEQTLLESHDAITSKYGSSGYDENLKYVQQNAPHAKYILSETGSALAGSPRSFDDAFDVTLWLVDFHLYSMSIGVQRIDSTQRPSSNHSLWVPDSSSSNPNLGNQYNPGPEVHAPYYGVPMIADFIGKSPGKVVQLLAEDTLTAYAMYDTSSQWNGQQDSASEWSGNGPSKVAIVNLNLWASDQGVPRGSQYFTIPVHPGARVQVSRLHADEGVLALGYDVQGQSGTITWAGETWSYSQDQGRGHQTGLPQREEVPICGGYAVIEVPDSEAVIVYLMSGAWGRP